MDIERIAKAAKEYVDICTSNEGFWRINTDLQGRAEVLLSKTAFFETFGAKDLVERWTGNMAYETEVDGVKFFALADAPEGYCREGR